MTGKSHEGLQKPDNLITRRALLHTGLNLACQVTLLAQTYSALKDLEDEYNILKNPMIHEKRLQQDAQLFKRNNIPTDYLQTALTSSASLIGTYMTNSFINSHLLQGTDYIVGSKSSQNARELLNQHGIPSLNTAITVLGTVAAIPIIEEAVFRKTIEDMFQPHLPTHGEGWNIGIPAAVFFALYHNVTIDPTALKGEMSNRFLHAFTFDDKSIPLPQFLLGVLSWHLLREKGLLHAIEGHATWNGASLLIRFGHKAADKLQRRLSLREQNLKREKNS